ncbi:MAG: hypothetical protein ABUK06_04985 [Dehalococcoidales bacterium]
MKKRWYSVLLFGIVLLLATLNTGCPSTSSQEELDAAYANGYNVGTSDGMVAGQAAGYDDGLVAGQAAGYDDGLVAGNTQGYQVGYWEAYYVFIGYLAQYEFIGDTESDFAIKIISLSTPIDPGHYTTLTATTLPYASCDITVTYASGPVDAEELGPKIANGSGVVSWTWKVDAGTTAGSWPIVVIASLGGIEVSDERDIVVN